MPRKRRGFEELPRRTVGNLVERLVDELKSDRQSGQPLIDEEEFPTGKLRVNVVWDEWDRVPLEDRTATILRAIRAGRGPGLSRPDRPCQRPDGPRGARGRHVAVSGDRRSPQRRSSDDGPVQGGPDRRRCLDPFWRGQSAAALRHGRRSRGGPETTCRATAEQRASLGRHEGSGHRGGLGGALIAERKGVRTLVLKGPDTLFSFQGSPSRSVTTCCAGDVLTLTPLLSVQLCAVCGQWTAFYLDKYDKDKHRAQFLHLIEGHSIEDCAVNASSLSQGGTL